MSIERREIPVTDEEGRRCVIVSVSPVRIDRKYDGSISRQVGLAELFNKDGERVTEERDGTYTTYETGRRYFPA